MFSIYLLFSFLLPLVLCIFLSLHSSNILWKFSTAWTRLEYFLLYFSLCFTKNCVLFQLLLTVFIHSFLLYVLLFYFWFQYIIKAYHLFFMLPLYCVSHILFRYILTEFSLKTHSRFITIFPTTLSFTVNFLSILISVYGRIQHLTWTM